MAGTYSRIYIHYVFTVKYRQRLLQKPWREEVFKYIAGIIPEKGQKPININGVEDHVHVLVGIKPSMAVAELARIIKNNSSNFINERRFLSRKFAWQEGYGVFSYSHDAMKRVYKYIERQEAHHARKKFSQEYIEFLEQYQVEYHEKFLFDWVDES